MRKYIENLTSHFILKNRYNAALSMIDGEDDFLLYYLKTDLLSGDVRQMSPKTLGKIMCSFEIGDVMASTEDLFNGVSFSGDCEEMLRELVAHCLAYKIKDVLLGKEFSTYEVFVRLRG